MEFGNTIEGALILMMMRFLTHLFSTSWKDARRIVTAVRQHNPFDAKAAKAWRSLIMVWLGAVGPATACWVLAWSPLNGTLGKYIITGLAMSAVISGAHSVGKWAGVVTEE